MPVRRGPLPSKKAANRVKIGLIAVMVAGRFGGGLGVLYRYGTHSWRFQLDSSDNIEVMGNDHVSRSEITRVFGGDISRNIFAVPLDDRKKQLEAGSLGGIGDGDADLARPASGKRGRAQADSLCAGRDRGSN